VIWALMRWVGFAAVAVVALVVAHMLAPGRKELELDVFVLVLGGLGLMVLASELRRLAPPAEGSRVAEALQPEPVEERPRPGSSISITASGRSCVTSRARGSINAVSTSIPVALKSRSSSATSCMS
jgi:hypothetical protein